MRRRVCAGVWRRPVLFGVPAWKVSAGNSGAVEEFRVSAIGANASALQLPMFLTLLHAKSRLAEKYVDNYKPHNAATLPGHIPRICAAAEIRTAGRMAESAPEVVKRITRALFRADDDVQERLGGRRDPHFPYSEPPFQSPESAQCQPHPGRIHGTIRRSINHLQLLVNSRSPCGVSLESHQLINGFGLSRPARPVHVIKAYKGQCAAKVSPSNGGV